MHALTRTPLAARGAQLLTIAALATGCLAYAASATTRADPADAAIAFGAVSPSITEASAWAGFAARAETAASRSLSTRSGDDATLPTTGLLAPELDAPRRPSAFGALGVKAVARPDPVEAAIAVANGASPGATAAAGGAPSGGSATAYAAAGAALGLVPSAAAVYSAVRSTFGITNIGGLRPGDWGDHGTGHAVDVMITSSAQGDAVAAYALANAGRFGIKYVIWQQRIWMPSTGVWRLMEDRGSPTQNHMDHVHISVN